jgi:hypothetical protein
MLREADEDGLDAEKGESISQKYRRSRKNPANDGHRGGKPHPFEENQPRRKEVSNVSPEKRLDFKRIQGNQRQGGERVSRPSRRGSQEEVQEKPQLGTTQ